MRPTDQQEIMVIDSHTGGEPTRTVIAGAPDFDGESLVDFSDDFKRRFDWLRTALVTEPRGFEAMVGAMLVPPLNPDNVAGVIFFNNVGYLGMCGHGTIGVAATLAHLGKISPGEHTLETPVGDVTFMLHEDNRVSFHNVPSYRYKTKVPVETKLFGTLHGDIAYGGNWFYLCNDHGLKLSMDNLAQLTACSEEIRAAILSDGITGDNGGVIDHIELVGPASREDANAKNFVMCPGGEYDRSPCGTGTSAKIACLAADEKLKPGETWGQESVTGSLFEGTFEWAGEKIIPRITGEAFITAEAKMILNPNDPLSFGISRK